MSWIDAARFTNWLHNGQGDGDTETGAYTLNGAISRTAPARNAGATAWLPTENEWFKAFYYDPTKGPSGVYWLHANQSDSMTSDDPLVAGAANHYDGDFSVTESSSYSGSQNYLTDAGTYGTDSQSYYGLNDMAGNVWEWNDLNAESGLSRGLRGGSRGGFELYLRSSCRDGYDPSSENSAIGFRVASVPEPSGLLTTAALIASSLLLRRRFRNSL